LRVAAFKGGRPADAERLPKHFLLHLLDFPSRLHHLYISFSRPVRRHRPILDVAIIRDVEIAVFSSSPSLQICHFIAKEIAVKTTAICHHLIKPANGRPY
jgi:hypothetical protein